MERHWVIVRRDRPELFHALSLAFMRRRGYVVVLDRRVASRRNSERDRNERRMHLADVEPFAIVPGSTGPQQHAAGR
jgi:hypothetical protein